MNYIANSVTPNSVREETRNGDTFYIIEDVPFIRAQELAGGYVPEKEIRANTPNWEVPLTVNHPTNDPEKPWFSPNHPVYDPGDYVSVDFHPLIREQLVIGNSENPRFDGEYTRVDMAVNADKAKRLGGHAEDIATKIENSERFNVSSQYAPKQLSPGEYDGKQRSNVEGIKDPDSIALLPHTPGQCDLSQGCGINPNPEGVTANMHVPMADDPSGEDMGSTSHTMQGNKSVDGIEYTGTATGKLDESEIPNDDYESHYVFDGETKSESSYPLVDADGNLRRGNVESAFELHGRAPDESKLLTILEDVNSEFDDPPIDPEDLEESMSSNDGSRVDWLLSFLGMEQRGNEGAESSVDGATVAETPEDDPRDPNTMSKKTAELVANHDFKEENLPSEDTECFDRIYDAVTSNESEEEEEQTSNEEFVTQDDLESFKDSLVDELSESMSANQEAQQKDELASKIVANSAEYEDKESVLEDYPTEAALEAKKESLHSGSAVPGAGAGLSANMDDELEDVSAGVFD